MFGKHIYAKARFLNQLIWLQKPPVTLLIIKFCFNGWTSAFSQSKIYIYIDSKKWNIYSPLNSAKVFQQVFHDAYFILIFTQLETFFHYIINLQEDIRFVMSMPFCTSSALKFYWDLDFSSVSLANSYNKLFTSNNVISMPF